MSELALIKQRTVDFFSSLERSSFETFPNGDQAENEKLTIIQDNRMIETSSLDIWEDILERATDYFYTLVMRHCGPEYYKLNNSAIVECSRTCMEDYGINEKIDYVWSELGLTRINRIGMDLRQYCKSFVLCCAWEHVYKIPHSEGFYSSFMLEALTSGVYPCGWDGELTPDNEAGRGYPYGIWDGCSLERVFKGKLIAATTRTL